VDDVPAETRTENLPNTRPTARCDVEERTLRRTAIQGAVCVQKSYGTALLSVAAKYKYSCMWSLFRSVRTECLHNAVNFTVKAPRRSQTQLYQQCWHVWVIVPHESPSRTHEDLRHCYKNCITFINFIVQNFILKFPPNVNSIRKRYFWGSLDWTLM
jgi:hypothetical protein